MFRIYLLFGVDPAHITSGHATDMVKCFPADSGPKVSGSLFGKKVYLKIPDIVPLNSTANTTEVIRVINTPPNGNLLI